MGKELTERMVSLVSEHGIYSDSFLMAETDRSYFWSSGHSGVIGYVRYGRHFKVVGGITAPAGMRADLLGAFLGFVRSERGTAGFLNIGDTDLRHGIRFAWERLGFIIDLKGIHAFKERFRPRYENRYACGWPDQPFPIASTLAFLKLWGAGKLDIPRTLKHFYRQKILLRRERKSLVKGKSV